MLFWLLVSLIVVLGGAGAVGSIYAANDKRRRALPPSDSRALPGGDKLIERTIRDLRIGDVVTIDGRDYLCEGVIAYDEDGVSRLDEVRNRGFHPGGPSARDGDRKGMFRFKHLA